MIKNNRATIISAHLSCRARAGTTSQTCGPGTARNHSRAGTDTMESCSGRASVVLFRTGPVPAHCAWPIWPSIARSIDLGIGDVIIYVFCSCTKIISSTLFIHVLCRHKCMCFSEHFIVFFWNGSFKNYAIALRVRWVWSEGLKFSWVCHGVVI